MLAFRYTAVLLSALFTVLCGAQTVQESWISPAAPDLSTTIQVGQIFQIRWTSDLAGLFSLYAPSVDPTDATLWLTISDDSLNYRVKITQGVNVKTTEVVNWRVTLSDFELSRSTKWVFRFAKADTTWEAGDDEISSSFVRVKAADPVEDTTTKTTTTPAAKTTDESEDAEPKTVTKTAAAPKSTDDETSKVTDDEQSKETETAAGTTGNSPATEETQKEASAGLSAGAKAGIAIAVVAGVGLTAAIAFMWRRKKKLDEESLATPAHMGFPAPPTPDAGAQAAAAYPVKCEVSEAKAYISTNELSGASISPAAVSPMQQPSPAIGSELSGAPYTPTPPPQPVQPAYQQPPAGSKLSGAPQQPIPQAYQNLASELSGASYFQAGLEAPYSPTPPRGNAAELR